MNSTDAAPAPSHVRLDVVEGTMAQAANPMGARHNRYTVHCGLHWAAGWPAQDCNISPLPQRSTFGELLLGCWEIDQVVPAYLHLPRWLPLYDFANKVRIRP